ncbi:hypothetical protein [Glaciimonas sp. PAMC28666]|uniref:hypothetical protein n=1 Tax=Glaciimonas sp. PAMC28666 TaxID=2807626 RepID=UPI0019627AAF|nr:hypothetical protein [Glaciimonas sp. PAMC28666]QRX82238.1 hypothetical protein JQN73_19430 [Glaciimonas sp. PAMC28666]
MDLNSIKTSVDYQMALKEIQSLMAAERGTPEGRRLVILATLVETYEAEQFPIVLAKFG